MTQQALSRQNGAFMKIVLIGANGTIGELVQTAMAGAGHEIVKVGRKSGDFQVDIESRESIRQLYQVVGSFDAVAVAAGEVVFAPLSQLTAENWQFSLGSKLMGQISLVQEAIPFVNEKGSFTLVSGVLNDEPIFASAAAATVSGVAKTARSHALSTCSPAMPSRHPSAVPGAWAVAASTIARCASASRSAFRSLAAA